MRTARGPRPRLQTLPRGVLGRSQEAPVLPHALVTQLLIPGTSFAGADDSSAAGRRRDA